MKAIVYEKYGPPEILQLEEVEKPAPKEDEVLVKVHAASEYYGDKALVKGEPFFGPPNGLWATQTKTRDTWR